ncbi:hypothetical protein [Leptospira meyeri]|uniref:hypothetical protein n=1 Tax=Leptospira meyeri TaxID=29508 RepID=UPI001FAF6169|nr:hypothetical protein [Leptospira meyeri]
MEYSNNMKISFTKKMILDDEFVEDGNATFLIRSYLKEDFIERMIKLKFSQWNPTLVAFTSYTFGNSIWLEGQGVTEANSWESEGQLIDRSKLTKHFQTSFENSSLSSEYAVQKIIPDVLSELLDEKLAESIQNLALMNRNIKPEEWETLINRYKGLSQEFLKSFELGT